MRTAVTGTSGLLGHALIRTFSSRGHQVFAGSHRSPVPSESGAEVTPLDLTLSESVQSWIRDCRPDVIVHTAAWTDVDGCERDPGTAERVNVAATRNLMAAVQAVDSACRVVYLSTDYVFDGLIGPYDEDATPNPINVYGRTKLEGEILVRSAGQHHTIIRAASFLGIANDNRSTFAESMLLAMRDRPPLVVAQDQRSNVTPVSYLSDVVVELMEGAKSGIWHAAGGEIVSRYELGQLIARVFGLGDERVTGVPYAQTSRPARRPLNGGLITKRPMCAQCPPLMQSLLDWKSELIESGRWHDR